MRKKLVQADAALGNAERLLPFSLVNPENITHIRKKFLQKPYEPEFEYPSLPELDSLWDSVRKVRCGSTKLGQLLKEEKNVIKKKILFTKTIGSEEFSKASAALYPTPTKKRVDQAHTFLLLPSTVPHRTIPYGEVKKILEQTFKLLQFKYAIKRTEMVTSAYLSNSHRELRLKAKERFSTLFTYRLAIHEIATHALRAENGRQQKLSLFQRGTPNYLGTEEGLAAYNEERAGVMSPAFLKNYAGRVVAVHYSQEHTFVETYKYLREWFGKEDAFTLTLRAKRGLPNGKAVGACTKDALYLDGYLNIKEYVSQGHALKPLYAGKIGLEDLKKLRGRNRLQTAKYIPEPVIEWVRQEQIKKQ